MAALEAVCQRGLIEDDLGIPQGGPTSIGIDNLGAVALSKSYVSNGKTKHIERRHLKIRELVQQMRVKPEYVPTSNNVADIFTKPLPKKQFEKLRGILLNCGVE